jgi:hypothetical protein
MTPTSPKLLGLLKTVRSNNSLQGFCSLITVAEESFILLMTVFKAEGAPVGTAVAEADADGGLGTEDIFRNLIKRFMDQVC